MNTLSMESLGSAGQDMAPAMDLALAASFGSVALWRAQFVALGEAWGVRPGWLLLTFLPDEGRLVNQSRLALSPQVAQGEPILALDMAAQADGDLASRMADIAWDKVYARYQHAVHAVGDALAADPAGLAQAVVLDVRRSGVFAQAPTMLPGATWRDPATVGMWAAELPTQQEVVVYCVYGHEVGRSTALQLRARGVNARFLAGGIDAWQKAGHPVQAKPHQEKRTIEDVTIRRVSASEAAASAEALADVLIDCVEGGASVSFMLPLVREKAVAFWRSVAEGVANGERLLLIAQDHAGQIVGTVQLILSMPDNQPHRGDVAKMLVHRSARRCGVAQRLMAAVDIAAREEGRTVLVLDTVTGGDAERLYTRAGWQRVGTVPKYALMPYGGLCDTTFFFKHL